MEVIKTYIKGGLIIGSVDTKPIEAPVEVTADEPMEVSEQPKRGGRPRKQ